MKALVALAVAVSAAAATFAYASMPISGEVLVTRDSLALPSGCSPRQVATVVNRFFDAFNRGDMDELDRIWVKEDSPGRPVEPDATRNREFRWYSVTEGGSVRTGPWRHRSVYDRPELLPYFVDRHRHNERMRLLSLDVGLSWGPGVGISFVVTREADDLPAGLGGRRRIAGGKGHIECDRQQISLWSMGMNSAPGRDVPRDFGLTCPQPPGWTLGGPAIACARGPNAGTLADDFKVLPASSPPSGRCGTRAVSLRVTRALSAFNVGLADEFARELKPEPTFRPLRKVLRSRSAIIQHVHSRYRAGEGWTATQLERVGSTARYRLSVVVVHQTKPLARGRVMVTVNCASGLISSWLGPGVRTPT